MLWIGTGVTLIVTIIIGVIAALPRRSDLGAVSEAWMAHHRAEEAP